MRNTIREVLIVAITVLVIALAASILNANPQTPKSRAATGDPPLTQQPLYTDFKGVRLGMTPQEVRTKLGDPVLKDDELDYFVLSENVTAQVAYDKTHKVKTISVDYTGGTGAPDYRSVVGTELDTRPDGSVFKIIRYEGLGFWVSYNRSVGAVSMVTITIQKI